MSMYFLCCSGISFVLFCCQSLCPMYHLYHLLPGYFQGSLVRAAPCRHALKVESLILVTLLGYRNQALYSRRAARPWWWCALQTSNVDNMYVNTHFVCKSVAMITCMLYSDAALQSHCISPFSHCNVAARYNVAMRTRVAVLYRPSCVTKTLYACHYQCIKCIASKLSTQIYHLYD